MISMLRKDACSGSIHDLAYIPTQNCLADFFVEGFSKGRQFERRSEDRKIAGC